MEQERLHCRSEMCNICARWIWQTDLPGAVEDFTTQVFVEAVSQCWHVFYQNKTLTHTGEQRSNLHVDHALQYPSDCGRLQSSDTDVQGY